jgi:hypothetical protein
VIKKNKKKIYDFLKLHRATRGATWRHTATYGAIWRHTATRGATWRHVAPQLQSNGLRCSHSKREKNIQKNNFRHHLKNFIVTSKVIRRRQQRSIDCNGIHKQSESEGAPNKQEGMGSKSIQVVEAILQVNFFYYLFYFSYLNKLLFRL